MLSDDDLRTFRDRYMDIVIKPHPESGHRFATWNDLLWEPTSTSISRFLDDDGVPENVAGNLLGLMAELGIACAEDVLHGVPLPIDYPGASMRHWQLRRELTGIVERMSDAQLQQLFFQARGVTS